MVLVKILQMKLSLQKQKEKFFKYPELAFELAFEKSNEFKSKSKNYVFRDITSKRLTFENVKTREYLTIWL